MLPTELSAHVWAYFVSLIGQTCNWETFRIPGQKSWTKIADDNGVAIESSGQTIKNMYIVAKLKYPRVQLDAYRNDMTRP